MDEENESGKESDELNEAGSKKSAEEKSESDF